MAENSTSSRRRSSSRRRGSQTSDRAQNPSAIQQLAYRHIHNWISPIEPVSPDAVDRIHQAALKLLEEVGMEVLGQSARTCLLSAGAEMHPIADGVRMRFDRDFVEQMVKLAPAEFILHARNPEHSVQMGGQAMVFSPVSSAPNAQDLDGGRRQGNIVDFRNFVRLGQSLNCIHVFGGYPVEPADRDVKTRHLDSIADFIKLSDKPFHAYSLGYQRITDGIDLARLNRGISHEQLHDEASLITIINTNSPLKLDDPMGVGIMEMAKAGQAICITPFTLSGAMAPVTIPGALVQQHAEFMVGLCLAQAARPGAKVIYGSFTSNVDMKSGAPAFGTPEYVRATQISGQLARKLGVPLRTSNANAGNFPDAQAAWESEMSLWAVMTARTNFVMHAAGWLEGGLSASFEKMMIDADLLQMKMAYLEATDFDEADLGLDAIADVGPGGHFFGTAHTMERYENAFYQPLLSDWRNFETWTEGGAPQTHVHANALWKKLLNEYQPPSLDPSVAEAVDAFVARRTEEGGAKLDLI